MTSGDADRSAATAEPRRRILVTGGCGFIGHAVVNELAGNGHEVIAADIAEPAQEAAVAAERRLTCGSPLNGLAYFVTNGEPLADGMERTVAHLAQQSGA
ncbi:MAG: NAD-dependent epimerase/dehydratase family protein [Acidimicrobiaceae bacterium]|nr:NAD-dependent epimerase/dehydratase family protein [Acidimicrobiaceae bacterium]